jgi:hypothetical protein
VLDRFGLFAFARVLLTPASDGPVNLIVTAIVVGALFVRLPTAEGPLGLAVAGLVDAWSVGLPFVLALGL